MFKRIRKNASIIWKNIANAFSSPFKRLWSSDRQSHEPSNHRESLSHRSSDSRSSKTLVLDSNSRKFGYDDEHGVMEVIDLDAPERKMGQISPKSSRGAKTSIPSTSDVLILQILPPGRAIKHDASKSHQQKTEEIIDNYIRETQQKLKGLNDKLRIILANNHKRSEKISSAKAAKSRASYKRSRSQSSAMTAFNIARFQQDLGQNPKFFRFTERLKRDLEAEHRREAKRLKQIYEMPNEIRAEAAEIICCFFDTMQKLQENIAKLDLSDEYKAKIDKLTLLAFNIDNYESVRYAMNVLRGSCDSAERRDNYDKTLLLMLKGMSAPQSAAIARSCDEYSLIFAEYEANIEKWRAEQQAEEQRSRALTH